LKTFQKKKNVTKIHYAGRMIEALRQVFPFFGEKRNEAIFMCSGHDHSGVVRSD
jgi:hypothetical protein